MLKTVRFVVVLLCFYIFCTLSANAATIDFEGIPNGSPVGTTYDGLGVTFNPSTAGVVVGPGSWAIVGTNGPAFLGFNGLDGYSMELDFTSPQMSLSLDVSRSAGSPPGETFTINSYNGANLIETQTITLGDINAWSHVTLSTGGFNRVTWDVAGSGFIPYGIDNIVFTASAPAATAVPTMNEWGMIIFMILAGFGSVYYVRRREV